MAQGILSALNPKQREAVEWCEGPELVLAGAGSGKTRVLTTKIAYLISEKKVAPYRILALTFTNKAAKEMRERVHSLVGANLRGMQVSTFHAYGLMFLHRHPDAVRALGYPTTFVIFDRGDVKSIVKNLMKRFDVDAKRYDLSWMIETISNAKTGADPVTLEPAIDDKWLDLYAAYCAELKKQGALDFDDLMMLPLHILSKDELLCERERASLDWILVDEYQDVNTPQYLLLRRLVGDSGRLMVVGDPDQSIYGWRGADVSMIMNFEKDFPGARVVVLDQNYRSAGNILAGANGVIKNNADRKPKDLWTSSPEGCKINVLLARNDMEESQCIVDEIECACDDGYKFGEIAILYRMNALSRGIEQMLLERGIPYRVVRGVAFYERREVKDVLSMMRLAINHRDAASLARIANVPARGLGKKSVEDLGAWLAEREEEPLDVWRAIKEAKPAKHTPLKGKAAMGAVALAGVMIAIIEKSEHLESVIDTILTDAGYEDFLRDEYPDDWIDRVENVRELLSVMPGDGSLAQALSEMALFTDMEHEETGDQVSLLTLHAAKGLEFPIVFMIAMEEGIFPNARCIDEPGGLSEERRLCYVGMTRAREKLYVSGAASRLIFGSFQRARYSRFISEIPHECSTIDDRNKGGAAHAGGGVNRRRWSW